MKFILKHLLLLSIFTLGCDEPHIIRHSYHYINSKNHTSIEGEVYGLEDMDHYNVMQAESIMHELVDDNKAKLKIHGTIKAKINEQRFQVESEQHNYFTVELEHPLQAHDSLIGKKCIFQGIGQMNESTKEKGRTLLVEAKSMIILH